ncbi:MAG: RdgB/HAM1 family non-canonical purine NTP pyrophosphatase, partial [Vulcanimicrobiaceae bacterium]
MRSIFVATTNRGKLAELRAMLDPVGWQLELFADYIEPVEGEESYAANAAIKARALAAQLRAGGDRTAVIADDSGLEVSALDGRPGVRSARYGGDASWGERRRLLLAELTAAASRDRSARFVCAIHFVDETGVQTQAIGEVRGRIAVGERGAAGFSYDAIFELPERGLTFAELDAREKNALSHRAAACR